MEVGKQAAPILQLQFAQNIGNVKLGGSLGNAEDGGNFFVGQSAHQQLKHLPFARSKRMTGQELRVEKNAHLSHVGSHDGTRNPDLTT